MFGRWFDKKLANEKVGALLKVNGCSSIEMVPGIATISRSLQYLKEEASSDYLIEMPITLRACKFINKYLRNLYILDHLYDIFGERGPKLLNEWGDSLKYEIKVAIHTSDDRELLFKEVDEVAEHLNIPVLQGMMRIDKDLDSSRC